MSVLLKNAFEFNEVSKQAGLTSSSVKLSGHLNRIKATCDLKNRKMLF